MLHVRITLGLHGDSSFQRRLLVFPLGLCEGYGAQMPMRVHIVVLAALLHEDMSLTGATLRRTSQWMRCSQVVFRRGEEGEPQKVNV